jgi:hypothetical protein
VLPLHWLAWRLDRHDILATLLVGVADDVRAVLLLSTDHRGLVPLEVAEKAQNHVGAEMLKIMMIADFGTVSVEEITLGQSEKSIAKTSAIAAANDDGVVVSVQLDVPGRGTVTIQRDMSRLAEGRRKLTAVQRRRAALAKLKSCVESDALAKNSTDPLIGQRIIARTTKNAPQGYPLPHLAALTAATIVAKADKGHPLPSQAEIARARGYVDDVRATFEQEGTPERFQSFTGALKSNKEGELNLAGLRDLMSRLLAQSPILLNGFDSFLAATAIVGREEAKTAEITEVAEKIDESAEGGGDLAIRPMFVCRLATDHDGPDGSNGSNESLILLTEQEVRY